MIRLLYQDVDTPPESETLAEVEVSLVEVLSTLADPLVGAAIDDISDISKLGRKACQLTYQQHQSER